MNVKKMNDQHYNENTDRSYYRKCERVYLVYCAGG